MSATLFDSWLGTGRSGIAAALVVAWFFLLNELVLPRYDSALGLLAIGGAVAGFFTLAFSTHVFINYVLDPAIRALAP